MSAHLRQAWGARIRREAAGGTIYRGLQVTLPQDLLTQVLAWLEMPVEEEQIDQEFKVGPALIEWLTHSGYDDGYGNVGLGRHWTTDRHMAEIATTHGNVGGNFAILLTGVYDDTDVDPEQTGTTKWMADSESEVTLRPGARITITQVEVEEGALAYHYIPVLRAPMQATAAGSWRGLSYEVPFWTQYDACIIPNRAARPSYEVYDHGRLVASRPRLDEAKAVLGADLLWRIEWLPKEVAIHYFFGVTDEFSDPTSVYVVDHIKTAVALRPLPVGPGVFYRVHPRGRPFSAADAKSEVFGRDGLPESIKSIVTPVAGYSAFANPWHLLQYAQDMGWDDGEDEFGRPHVSDPVVRFEGKQVGEGYDGEPTVMPSSGILETIDWSDFQDRLEVTSAAAYPRWDEAGVTGAVDFAKPTSRNLSESQVLAICQKILADMARQFGYEGGLPEVQVTEYLGGGTARAIDSSREFPNGAILLSRQFWFDRAKDKELGVAEFRIFAHEAVHALVQRDVASYSGFQKTVTEGGAEVLSLAYWAEHAPAFDDRDAVRRDGQWMPGAPALAAHVVYHDEFAEMLRRSASRVGWDQRAICRDIQALIPADHNTKIDYMHGTDPAFPPPSGYTIEAESLAQWLVSGYINKTGMAWQVKPSKASGAGEPNPKMLDAMKAYTEHLESMGHVFGSWRPTYKGDNSAFWAECQKCGTRFDAYEFQGTIHTGPNGWRSEAEDDSCIPARSVLYRGYHLPHREFGDIFDANDRRDPYLGDMLFKRLSEGVLELRHPEQGWVYRPGRPGYGKSWTISREIADMYSRRNSDDDILNVLVTAEISREWQKPNYRSAPFVILEGFEHEHEQYLAAKEHIRIISIEVMRDGQWVNVLAAPRMAVA